MVDGTRKLDDDTNGSVTIGDHTVRRMAFGAMRVSGARNAAGVRDRDEAIRLYRRVYERGVNFIDVANIYGYGECEEILAEALHPYPDDLLVGTKAGFAFIPTRRTSSPGRQRSRSSPTSPRRASCRRSRSRWPGC